MIVFDPDPSLKWAFFFAHPDDELAISNWMKRLVTCGASVSAFWAHSTPVRKQESLRVVELIGVQDVHFAEFVDGHLVDELPDLCKWTNRCAQITHYDCAVCASFEQGHLDHDALNFAVSRAFSGSTILDFPEYWHYGTPFKAVCRYSNDEYGECLRLTAEESKCKLKWAQMYPSQRIYSLARLANIREKVLGNGHDLGSVEQLRRQPLFNYLEPAHPPKRARQIAKTKEWQRWCAAIHSVGWQMV